ncbi:helix-turn-helix domain-containing protein [Paenibacillus periandrae]|uniref:helix-turn-helix domain-containing protein n=1 Tax=Paenibacillus periandrae TaxID=1761741 RepID=UPI001F09C0BC|nr:helix-turn-helix domain-containing protein [Paenibacillus periandrae]
MSKVRIGLVGIGSMGTAHVRINQARIEFVLDPNVSVTDVCFRVGFKHLAHFSRVFKELVGVTPVQYKKLLTATPVQ